MSSDDMRSVPDLTMSANEIETVIWRVINRGRQQRAPAAYETCCDKSCRDDARLCTVEYIRVSWVVR